MASLWPRLTEGFGGIGADAFNQCSGSIWSGILFGSA